VELPAVAGRRITPARKVPVSGCFVGDVSIPGGEIDVSWLVHRKRDLGQGLS
jgi:hypothetical protein